MNRTNLVIALIAAFLLLIAGSAQTDLSRQQGATVGRYQLLAVEHLLMVPGMSTGGQSVKEVLRIDTATGATDVWRESVDRGQLVNAWSPIR